MKRTVLALVMAMIAIAAMAQQQPVTGTITTATAGPGNCVSARTSNNATVGIILSGVWSGTITPNVQISTASGAPTIAKKVVPVDSTTAQATITVNGGYLVTVAGFTTLNLCATAWTSGTATVTLYAVAPVNNTVAASGGGGSGTVNSGTTNQLAIYPANGTTVQGDATLTDNGTTLAYTGTGGVSSAGGVSLTGAAGAATTISTSTANAKIAMAPNGTGTVQFNNGATGTPSISFVNDTASGIWSRGNHVISFSANGNDNLELNGNTAINMASNVTLCYASGALSSTGGDTCNSRTAAGNWSLDTTAAGNGLGSMTTCRTTVNVSPVTVNTSTTSDQNLMAFTLPANCLNSTLNGGRTLRVFVAGVYSTAATSTAQMTLKVKICSVSGCGSGNVASVISIQSVALGSVTVTNNAWNGTFYITTQTGSTTGAWEAHGAFGIDLGAVVTAADSFFNDTNTATITGSPSAIDTTAQNFLQVSFAFSAASASNTATQRQLVIDSVN